MPLDATLRNRLSSYVDSHRDRLVKIIRDLVRIPSENMPPIGNEEACQQHVAEFLKAQGLDTELYYLCDVPELEGDPLFYPGRDYSNRPNVGARLQGVGGGRSLVLSGHVDTVPRGTQPWTRDPFGGEVEGDRLYGRGSNDMKGGVGTNLFMAEALRDLGIKLKGDLIIETVADEEFGGVNGTIAGRVKGYNGDAAIIAEPSFLRICPAHRGGRTVQITLSSAGGVLPEGKFPTGVIDPIRYFLVKMQDFAEQRKRNAPVHEIYAGSEDPVPVSITKLTTGPWGTKEPITIPETCQIEMYWQLMPGENQDDVEREFHEWFGGIVKASPEFFPTKPKAEFPIRWLPGSAISRTAPLVGELAECVQNALGEPAVIQGFEAPCDMYVFHQAFKTPAVLWGPRGGNTHAADEYLEISSVVAATKAQLEFVCQWCGIAS
ncbi:MAG: M20/M25/M40 family metallo-hydrolase [Acidobacteria bacterium]|nr:M20/M25/M40 family metallo-hydrolase [Acidobacteriota bacterium]